MESFLSSPSVYLPSVDFILSDDPSQFKKNLTESVSGIELQPDVPSISLEPIHPLNDLTSFLTEDPLHNTYYSSFPTEVSLMSQVQQQIEKGIEFIHYLYTYRSLAKAIPEISKDFTEIFDDENLSENLSNPLTASQNLDNKDNKKILMKKKTEIEQKIIDILSPEMEKIKNLLLYITDSISLFIKCLNHINLKEIIHKNYLPSNFYTLLLNFFDILIILDNIKNKKSCLKLDFIKYKRILYNSPSIEILEELNLIQNFLSNIDSKLNLSYIFYTLKNEVKRINNYNEIIFHFINIITEKFENYFHEQSSSINLYSGTSEFSQDANESNLDQFYDDFIDLNYSNTTYNQYNKKYNFFQPEEKFRSVRILPYLLLLVDTDYNDTVSNNSSTPLNTGDKSSSKNIFNIFKLKDSNKSIKLNFVQKLFKIYPILPCYGDISINLIEVLKYSTNFTSEIKEQWQIPTEILLENMNSSDLNYNYEKNFYSSNYFDEENLKKNESFSYKNNPNLNTKEFEKNFIYDKINDNKNFNLSYNILKQFPYIEKVYVNYMIRLSHLINLYNKKKILKINNEKLIKNSKEIYFFLYHGQIILTEWVSLLKLFITFKLNNPISDFKLIQSLKQDPNFSTEFESKNKEKNENTETHTSNYESIRQRGQNTEIQNEVLSPEDEEIINTIKSRLNLGQLSNLSNPFYYSKVLKYNLNSKEIFCLIDLINIIKNLSSKLIKFYSLFAPYLKFFSYYYIQKIFLFSFNRILYKLDKKNNPNFNKLLKLRQLMADYLPQYENEILNEYKDYKNKNKKSSTSGGPAGSDFLSTFYSNDVNNLNKLASSASHFNNYDFEYNNYIAKDEKKSKFFTNFLSSSSSTIYNTKNKVLPTPSRITSPSLSKLFLILLEFQLICNNNNKKSFFSSSSGSTNTNDDSNLDLNKKDLDLLSNFMNNIKSFFYILNYTKYIKSFTNMSEFWLREYHLELTKSIQFPIELSLPWILIEEILLKMNNNFNYFLILKIFNVLDIYNDAGERLLYYYNQQFLYDELEAETNLILDQFYYLITDILYTNFKYFISFNHLDKSFLLKLFSVTSSSSSSYPLNIDSKFSFTKIKIFLTSILNQKTINMLGRSINLSYIFQQNLLLKFYNDIELVIKKFESQDIRGIIELVTNLKILKLTHDEFNTHLNLDPFHTLLYEVNESLNSSGPGSSSILSPGSGCSLGRIFYHLLNSLVRDILSNYSYNKYTERFIPSPIYVRYITYTKPPKVQLQTQFYGSSSSTSSSYYNLYKIYENIFKLSSEFFGYPHYLAILSLPPTILNLPVLLDQTIKNLFDKVLELSEYLSILKNFLDNNNSNTNDKENNNFNLNYLKNYFYFSKKLKNLLNFDDLKPEIFQLFREIGNSYYFLYKFSNILETKEFFNSLKLSLLYHPIHLNTQGFLTSISNTNIPSNSILNFLNSTINKKNKQKITSKSNPVQSSPLTFLITNIQLQLNNNNSNNNINKNVIKNFSGLEKLSILIKKMTENYYYNLINSDSVPSTSTSSSNSTSHYNSTISNNSQCFISKSGSFISNVFEQLEEFLYQQNLTLDWSPFTDSNGRYSNIIDVYENNSSKSDSHNPNILSNDNLKGYTPIFSSLCFLFNLSENEDESDTKSTKSNKRSSKNDEDDEENDDDKDDEFNVSNYAEFGHGFYAGGLILLHLLNQQSVFKLYDITSKILELFNNEKLLELKLIINNNYNSGGSNINDFNNSSYTSMNLLKYDYELKSEVKKFISNSHSHKILIEEILLNLNSLYKPRDSYIKNSYSKVVFHPLSYDDDEDDYDK